MEENDDGSVTVKHTVFPKLPDSNFEQPLDPVRTRTETAPTMAKAIKKATAALKKGEIPL